MNTIQPQETMVDSGKTVKYSGFYEPEDHTSGQCIILETEQRIFLAKGSDAPKILSCQHNITWRLIPFQ